MRIDVLTLFPDMFAPLKESIIARGEKSGKFTVNVVNIRDYSADRHKKCDDSVFGGGSGMLMTCQPIADAIKDLDPEHKSVRIYLSPKGKTLSQRTAKRLSEKERLLLLCGHYEGVDQRIIDLFIDEEISIGDYVLTGGELPAMVLCDCVLRQIEGVINSGSLAEESFTDGLLEYPQYTKPQEFMGLAVPPVLISGNHGEIDKWRKAQSLALTKKLRPDLTGGEEK